jgi:hypothetical protein
MFPRKWKIFRIMNYIQMSYCLLLILATIYFHLQGGNSFHAETIIFLACCVAMICNNYQILFIIRHYFPDKAVPKTLERLNAFLYMISFLISVALLFFIIFGFVEQFSSKSMHDIASYIALGVCILILVHVIYTYVNQMKLVSVIERQHYRAMAERLRELGKENE